MQQINNEFQVKTIISSQKSTMNTLGQEKFSDFLHNSEDKEQNDAHSTEQDHSCMQSLQNQANLNRLLIEAVS